MDRRAVLLGGSASAAALLLGPLAAIGAAAPTDGEVRWIAARPAGKRNGIGRTNAAPMEDLPDLVAAVGAGGTILLDSSRAYVLDGSAPPLTLSSGGLEGLPVVIRGAKPDASPARAVVRSDRTDPWSPGDPEGCNWIEFTEGCQHVRVEGVNLDDLRRPFWVTGTVPGLALVSMRAMNVEQLLDVSRVYGTRGRTPGSVPDLLVSDVVAKRFTRPLIQLRAATGATIENVVADAGGPTAGHVTGITLSGTNPAAASRGVVIRRCDLRGFHGITDDYLQGDGITASEHDHELLIEDTTITDCLDGGVDLKSADSECRRVSVSRAKRSFRFHRPAVEGRPLRLVECTSIDPVNPGDIIAAAHLQATGDVVAVDCTYSDRSKLVRLVEVTEGATVRFAGGSVVHPGPLLIVDDEGTVLGVETLARPETRAETRAANRSANRTATRKANRAAT